MATTVQEQEKLERRMEALRTEAQRKASRRLWWWQALTSLWAPITVLAIVLVPYLIVIEGFPSSQSWAFPAMQGFGLLMLAWFVVLSVARIAGRFRLLRAARAEAREVTSEVGRLLRRRGTSLDPTAREKLVACAASVDALRIQGDVPKLKAEIDKLSGLTEKVAPRWRRRANIDFAWGFAKALAIALVLRIVVIAPFRIPSGSMIPTLQVGDQIFVNKFIYGVRIPFTNYVPFTIVRPPHRGDIIVFNNPTDNSVDYIKRVIGVPGDVIEIKNDILYVNGKPQPRQLVNPRYVAWDHQGGPWYGDHEALYREDLTGHSHLVLQNGSSATWLEGPYEVPPKHVFVMGDNRDESEDSRYGLGRYPRQVGVPAVFVPYGNIKGKAMIVWLSLSHGGLGSSLFGGRGLTASRFFMPLR